MKVVWSWLREFVPVEASPEDVADRLSARALKVERVPSRTMRTEIACPTFAAWIASVRSVADATVVVLMPTMTSPLFTPAFSAGLPSTTRLTSAPLPL